MIQHPSSRHLRPGLNCKILDVALLRLRFCSIGQVKSAANPGAGEMAVFCQPATELRLFKNSQIVATAESPEET